MMRAACLFICLFIMSSVNADPDVTLYKADYSVHLNGFKVGELQRSLEHLDDGHYLLRTHAYTSGVVSWFKPYVATEETRWHFNGNTPRPLSYTYHNTGRDSERLEQQDFDWEKGILRYQRGKTTKELKLDNGVVDKQVFEILMRQSLRSGVTSEQFQVANRGRITEYEFEVLGMEDVVTKPYGRLKTIKVQRGDTIMWLSEQHDYLIVKIEHHKDGNVATSYLMAMDEGGSE